MLLYNHHHFQSVTDSTSNVMKIVISQSWLMQNFFHFICRRL